MRISICCLFAVLRYHLVLGKGPKAGPYDILIQKVEVCDDEGTGQIRFVTNLNIKGGVITYNDDVHILIPVDNTIKADMELLHLSNGVYKSSYLKYSFNGCEHMVRMGKEFVADFLRAAGYEFKDCPLPAGNYSVKDWELKPKLDMFPVMTYNSYKGVVNISKSGTKVGCVACFVDIVPKSS